MNYEVVLSNLYRISLIIGLGQPQSTGERRTENATRRARAGIMTVGGSDAPRFHFLHIPKCAGETVNRVLVSTNASRARVRSQDLRLREIQHRLYGANASAWRKMSHETLGSCGAGSLWFHVPPRYWTAWPPAWSNNSFCIVRDPVDRALSDFKMDSRHSAARLSSAAAAGSWLKSVARRTKHFGCHWINQSAFVWDASGRRTCQHVLCYERLRSDFDQLMAKLRVPTKPWSEVPPVTHHPYTSLTKHNLSKETRDALHTRYASDACFLGYGPCDEALMRKRAALERPVDCEKRWRTE
jgi:hypothetical protein